MYAISALPRAMAYTWATSQRPVSGHLSQVGWWVRWILSLQESLQCKGLVHVVFLAENFVKKNSRDQEVSNQLMWSGFFWCPWRHNAWARKCWPLMRGGRSLNALHVLPLDEESLAACRKVFSVFSWCSHWPVKFNRLPTLSANSSPSTIAPFSSNFWAKNWEPGLTRSLRFPPHKNLPAFPTSQKSREQKQIWSFRLLW